MQFSVVAIVAAFASVAAAQYGNGTAVVPSGTAAPSASGAIPSSTAVVPFPGAGSVNTAGSIMAIVAAGGVALMI